STECMNSASGSGDSANTARPSPDRSIAPVHIPHGWQLVYMVDAAAMDASSSLAAHLASFSSGWGETSPSAQTPVHNPPRRELGSHGRPRRDGCVQLAGGPPSQLQLGMGRDIAIGEHR